MNGLDIGILVILAAFLLKGLFRGLLKELCSLLGLVTGGWLALWYHAPLADATANALRLPLHVCTVAAYLLLFFAAFLFFTVLGYLLSRFAKALFLGGFNRVAGGFFGLAQGVLLLALVLFALSLQPLSGRVQPELHRSRLAAPFVQLGETVFHGSRRSFAGWR